MVCSLTWKKLILCQFLGRSDLAFPVDRKLIFFLRSVFREKLTLFPPIAIEVFPFVRKKSEKTDTVAIGLTVGGHCILAGFRKLKK
jgi:hypothetical protein